MANNKVGRILIGSDTPSGRPDTDWGNFAWIDTATRTVKTYETGSWKVEASFADTTSTEGYTGKIKHGNDTMVFEKGILVKYD